jgi:hypothetical protein
MKNDDVPSDISATFELSVSIEELERIIAPGVATSPGPIPVQPIHYGSR